MPTPGRRAENARALFLARGGRVVFMPMDERERRIAENEAFWRQLNELSPPEPGMLNAVFCECGRLECSERVPMTAAEYHAVRARATTFVVAPGHEQTEVEQVIETNERFRIVEKEGEAAEIAIQTDPT
jgi:hypothetical protein